MAFPNIQRRDPDSILSLVGDKELVAMLKELPKAVRERVLKPGMKVAAKGPIKKQLVADVPLQKKPYGGQSPKVRLKRKIADRARPRGKKWTGWRVLYPTREMMSISPTAKYYYPAHLEYGTLKRGGHLAPRKYMFLALRKTENVARRIIESEIRRLLPIEAKKVADKRRARQAKP